MLLVNSLLFLREETLKSFKRKDNFPILPLRMKNSFPVSLIILEKDRKEFLLSRFYVDHGVTTLLLTSPGEKATLRLQMPKTKQTCRGLEPRKGSWFLCPPGQAKRSQYRLLCSVPPTHTLFPELSIPGELREVQVGAAICSHCWAHSALKHFQVFVLSCTHTPEIHSRKVEPVPTCSEEQGPRGTANLSCRGKSECA